MSHPAIPMVRMLDELGANATAATTVRLVDGWLLRAAPEYPFRRCNSALPYIGDGIGVESRVSTVEEFYGDWDLQPRFQISPAALPPGLDDLLEARGYEIEEPTLVLIAETGQVVERTALADADADAVTVVDGIDEFWIAEYASAFSGAEPGRDRLRAYGHLLRDLGPAVGTAVLPVDDKPAAVGLGVHERGWVGVYAMGTRPEARRQGAATVVLNGLARWAEERGAHRMYLQVEVTNDGARQLYTRAGFVTSYRYHYRTA